MKKVINLTKFPFCLETENGRKVISPPSGKVARVETHLTPHDAIEVDGEKVMIHRVRKGGIVGLPEPQPDTLFVVDAIVADAANRADVASAGEDGFLVPEAALMQQRGNTSEILRLDDLGVSQGDIANMLGMTRQGVSQALKRHKKATQFSDDELSLIVMALNGVRCGVQSMDGLPIKFHIINNIVDGIKLDRLDQKWDVNRASLARKMEALTDTQAKDLSLKVSRFWDAAPHTDIPAGLRKLGFSGLDPERR